ncbi:MAG: Crp/Fnr family transcriptional regulator [Ferruginibacter sp.]
MKSVSDVFPTFSRQLVQEIEQHAELRTYTAGETIMRTGQYIKSTMLLMSGTIKIYREDEEGNEFFMYYLHPGQACAISMICATRSEASQVMAKAIEDAEVLMIPLEHMEKWMAAEKSWYEFVIETYRGRFEEVLLVLDSVAFRAMDERLEFYLKRHVETTGSKLIQLSHQEIASDLNSSREVISRLLKKMEQRGMLRLFRNQIEMV